MFGGRVLQQAGSSYLRFVPLYVWDFKLHTGAYHEKKKRSYPDPLMSLSIIQMMFFPKYVLWNCYWHLLHWAWNKGYHRSASYLELHLEIDNAGRLRTQLYDKRDDFNISKIRRGTSKDKVFNLRCSFVFFKTHMTNDWSVVKQVLQSYYDLVYYVASSI
jgi:hypothetical protein